MANAITVARDSFARARQRHDRAVMVLLVDEVDRPVEGGRLVHQGLDEWLER
jgi:hypothetical protein